MTPTGGGLRLVADIGGTNARFALASGAGETGAAASLRVADFPRFDDALGAYLARLDEDARARIESAAFAAAGPVEGDTIKLTNAPWRIAAHDVSARLDIPIRLFNDLQAVALALPFLGTGDVAPVGPAPFQPASTERMVAVNVGTGFGAATAIHAEEGWLACPSEAGHMSLPAANAKEAELLSALVPGHVATLEDVLSGAGVGALYAAVSGEAAIDAGAVFAQAGDDPAARRVVALMSRWLGRAAGDLVLASAAWGGAYLLGGVVNGWAAHCDTQAFRAAFEDKGKMYARMRGVFSGVVTRQDVALLGLAKAAIGGGDQ